MSTMMNENVVEIYKTDPEKNTISFFLLKSHFTCQILKAEWQKEVYYKTEI